MITIDIKTGELKVNQLRFSSKTEISYLSEMLLSSDIELWFSHDIWRQYRFFNDRMIFILHFKNNLLQFIQISPIENEGATVLNIIEKLGGEQEYFWGKIEIFDDIKSRSISVLIKYFK
ncbi:hypothetical protein [Moheibacter sediminis]|uniref:Uncharacterized protein n=1 Tax=Moheibacter sediminis TaxID=1434700 RepID=A0A1W1ZJG5_9FLAO|nr:hypothetical protein [Moheibacter sediminis]SMC48690.1 hypothetical protein SAMN06296427_1035 [Moheibacter sediminis]